MAKSNWTLTRSLAVAMFVGACTAGEGPRSEVTEGDSATPAAPLPEAPGGRGIQRNANLAEKLASVDASRDGWDTEVLSGEISRQLDAVGKLLVDGTGADPSLIVEEGFSCSELRPEHLETVYARPPLTVRRPGDAGKGERDELRGGKGLMRALARLRAPFEGGAHAPKVKFKLVTVEQTPGSATTQLYYQAHGPTARGTHHQNATWACEWTVGGTDTTPLLKRIDVVFYEESDEADGELFADCTESVLGANDCWKEQLLPHVETWLGSIQGRVYSEFLGHQGLALGDVDGDGLDDVYLCQPGGLPNRLFVHNPDGTATDRSAEAGVDVLEPSRGALLVDLDEDGDQDLLLSLSGAPVFLANDGTGKFEPRWYTPVPQIHSMAAADYDEDGDLDVYLCAYKIPDEEGAVPVPYQDANNGQPNVLLRNDGNWSFTDVTAEVGLDENNRRYSFAASWEDYDNDGDMDLYVANDFGRNNLYRNEGGRFVDAAAEAGVEDISAGMSVSWGDYDNDGLMDLYVSNMFSSAGNRIAYQRRFQEGVDERTRAEFQRHARGNSLFKNMGDGTFRDESVPAHVTMGRWAWGSTFVDLNNDGLQDLLVGNGFVTSDEPHDL